MHKNRIIKNEKKNLPLKKEKVKEPKNFKKSICLIKDCISKYFCVFKSINNIFHLIYLNKKSYIISYDLTNSKVITRFKLKDVDIEIKYFFDSIHKKDLILLISFDHLKIFDISNWSIIVDIKESINNINKKREEGRGMNCCLLNNNNQNFIITSNYDSDYFRIYDFNGNKIKNIKTPNSINIEIETYQDYIISGNINRCTSYNFNTKKFKHYEIDNQSSFELKNIITFKNKKGENILIAKCRVHSNQYIVNHNIFIWDFKSSLLINKIVYKIIIEDPGLLLWNENYLIVGTSRLLKILYISKNRFIKEIETSNYFYNFKKILHPKYGECLILVNNSNFDNTIKILFD